MEINYMNKLVTHEDPYHIHKICGIYSILNYIFQLTIYFVFGVSYLNGYTLFFHFMLPATSFFFKVLSKRPVGSKMSMFIWKELQIHSLLFAWRALFIILFPAYSVFITFATMICADIATYNYGTPGISTVRGDHTRVGNRNMLKEAFGTFFSISQMGATIITAGFFQEKPSSILLFSTLPAIQTSAFGMTLLRKDIITKTQWSIIYSLELVLSYVVWYAEYKNIDVFFACVIIYFLRKYTPLSKYGLWTLVLFVDTLIKTNKTRM